MCFAIASTCSPSATGRGRRKLRLPLRMAASEPVQRGTSPEILAAGRPACRRRPRSLHRSHSVPWPGCWGETAYARQRSGPVGKRQEPYRALWMGLLNHRRLPIANDRVNNPSLVGRCWIAARHKMGHHGRARAKTGCPRITGHVELWGAACAATPPRHRSRRVWPTERAELPRIRGGRGLDRITSGSANSAVGSVAGTAALRPAPCAAALIAGGLPGCRSEPPWRRRGRGFRANRSVRR